MSTIKQIIQNFCYRVNIPAPAAIVGVNSPTEQQYLSLFQFVGDNLRNRDFQWPQLKRDYTFNTQIGVRRYQLPGDFYRLLESTQWDQTNQWPMRGPISDYNYTVREFAVVSLQTRKAFRIIGPTNYVSQTSPYTSTSQGWFQIDPAGDNNTDELYMGYISCNWVWPKAWVANTVYAFGDLVSVNGYFYICVVGGTSSATRPSDPSQGNITDGTVTWNQFLAPYMVTSSNTKLNDDDICLFDDDIMVEGMRWAYYRAKGQDYQQERTDWENMVKSAFARFNGPVRINLCDEFGDFFDWPNSAQGSWNV